MSRSLRSIPCLGLALGLLLAPAVAAAQPVPTFTYGKADELKDVAETDWDATAEAGLVVTTGNSQTITLTGGAKAARKQKQNKFAVEASGTFARSSNEVKDPALDGDPTSLSADDITRESVTSAQSYNVKLRYDRFLSTWDSLYVAALGGADIIAGKDFVGGGQVGYARILFKSEEHEIGAELGYDFSYENLADGSDNNIHSGRGFVGYKGKLAAETSADASLEVLVNGNRQSDDIGPGEDTRATGTAGISTKITKGIALSVSLTAKFDAAPAAFAAPDGVMLDPTNPPERSMLDTTTKASLIITLL
jgi:hypothetical protein